MSIEETEVELRSAAASRVRWFSRGGCVAWSADGERAEVFVAGELVGSFSRRGEGQGVRNALMVQLAEGADVHLGRLAAALDVTEETLRLVRRLYEREGIEAVVARRYRGGRPVLSAKQVAQAEKLLAQGASLRAIQEHFAERGKTVSRETLRGVRTRRLERIARADSAPPRTTSTPVDESSRAQSELPLSMEEAGAHDSSDEPMLVPVPASAPPDEGHDTDARDRGDRGDAANPAPTSAPARGGAAIQHAGAWLLVAMATAGGLFEACERERRREDRKGPRPRAATLRIAVEALLVALAIEQRCVEGVRRVATPTADILLRASHAPSASWVRRVLGALAADSGGTRVLLRLAGDVMRRAVATSGARPAVFYVDNHVRPYTGKEVIRKGWRMQDRRVVPANTDCYVHDEDGRPVLRIHSPEHDSLTSLLGRTVTLLRAGIGEAEPILLAFDRAGAFPAHLAELRERGVQFATYERRPYPLLAATAFDQELDLGDGETLRWTEDRRKNLAGGRGRVRRIVVLDEDGRQVNILAVSDQPAPWVIGVMRGRWKQENAFKHGAARWGQDQLDARTIEEYPPDAIIPNPARRRLDHAIRLARVREGDARRELARLPGDSSRRTRIEEDLREALDLQDELEAQRPHTPHHAPVAETELAGKLVRHTPEMKHLVDATRIACANAESELAAMLGRYMTRPREAKKLLANVFAAPANVRVGARTIAVDLALAANGAERGALEGFFDEVSELGLTLPGDPRTLRFRSQVSNT